VFLQLSAHALVQLLQELQAAVLDERPPGLHVVGQQLRELLEDVLLDLDRGVPQQGLEGLEVCALRRAKVWLVWLVWLVRLVS